MHEQSESLTSELEQPVQDTEQPEESHVGIPTKRGITKRPIYKSEVKKKRKAQRKARKITRQRAK